MADSLVSWTRRAKLGCVCGRKWYLELTIDLHWKIQLVARTCLGKSYLCHRGYQPFKGEENGVFCRVGAWRSRGWCDGERFALVPISFSRIVHHAVSALELFIQEFARRLCSGCRFALTSDHAFVVQEFSGGRQRFTCSADTIFIQGPAATGAFQGFPFTA